MMSLLTDTAYKPDIQTRKKKKKKKKKHFILIFVSQIWPEKVTSAFFRTWHFGGHFERRPISESLKFLKYARSLLLLTVNFIKI